MASTMETWAKVMGAKAVIGGGVEKMNKMLSGESKALKQQRKRQRAEEKEQKKILLAEEMETHKQWMRENGSYIQAIKDRVSGYKNLSEEEKERADSRGVEEVRNQIERKKIEKQTMASAISGISAREYENQQIRNEATQRKRQAERDIKKKSIANAKASELRIQALAEELKNLGEFNNLTKDEVIEAIKAKELRTQNAELQEKIQNAESAYLDTRSEEEKLEEKRLENMVKDLEGQGRFAGMKEGEILEAIQSKELETKQNEIRDKIIKAEEDILGFKRKEAKETEEKGDSPSKSASKAVGDAPKTGGDSVSMVSILDGDPLGIESEQIDELLEIEREELAMDRRREAREIKAARMALEDRRDKKFALGAKPGGPSLMKKDPKEGGGFLSSLMKFGGKFLMPLLGLGGGWLGMKNILGLSTKVDDIARAGELGSKIAGKSDEVAKAVTKVDDAIKPLSKVDDVAKVGTKVDDAVKPLSKIDDVAKVGTKVDEAGKVAAKGAKVTSDITEAGAKTATKIDDAAKVLAKGEDVLKVGDKVADVSGALAKGVKSTNVGKLTGAVDGLTDATGKQSSWLSKVTSKMDETAKAVLSMGKKVDDAAKIATAASKVTAATNAASAVSGVKGGPTRINPRTGKPVNVNAKGQFVRADGLNKLDDAAKVKGIPGTDVGGPGSKGNQAVQKGTKVAADLLAKGAKPISDTVKTTVAVVKGGTKLATRLGKVLAPLDILNKVVQGQGWFEAVGNMGMEIVNLAAGAGEGIVEGVQSLAGGTLGEGGFSDKSAADIAFQDADILGNKEKWQTSMLEQGINKGVEIWTGQEIANKKVWTEEQEAMVDAAEDAGAVDTGIGQGDIASLEKLSLLDPDSLQALLDYEVWDDEDMGIIMELLAAKKAGKSVTYDDGGVFGAESIKYGGGVQPAITPVEGGTSVYGTVLPNEFEGTGRDAIAQTDILRAAQAEGERVAGVTAHSEPLTTKAFDDMTPTAELQDATNAAMLKPGSIFVHDTHLEKLLGPALGASPEMPPAGMLENLLVTRGMENQANAEASQAGATQMINAPTTIDNTSTQIINQGSSAHAPGVPAGSGQMGIGSRG